jgi:hypothetical protein
MSVEGALRWLALLASNSSSSKFRTALNANLQ